MALKSSATQNLFFSIKTMLKNVHFFRLLVTKKSFRRQHIKWKSGFNISTVSFPTSHLSIYVFGIILCNGVYFIFHFMFTTILFRASTPRTKEERGSIQKKNKININIFLWVWVCALSKSKSINCQWTVVWFVVGRKAYKKNRKTKIVYEWTIKRVNTHSQFIESCTALNQKW